jgi:polysaccharide export outer membrane protein
MDSRFVVALLILVLTVGGMAQERTIEAGDQIEIVVYGHQELSRVVRVSETGTIDFPFMQSVPVDGVTPERLKEIVVAQLSRYLDTYPLVTVSLVEEQTMGISVMGMVQKPGQVKVPEKSTLQAAVSAAGGFVPGARFTEVTVMRSRDNRAQKKTYNLETFLLEGDLSQNPVLRDGDVVMVTGNPVLSSVKVVGEVNNPGTFQNFSGATVLDMILMAGGPTEEADLNNVKYISPSRKKSIEFSLDIDKYLNSDSYNQLPVVKPGDVIALSEKTNYWRVAMSAIRDIGSILILVWYVDRIND